MAYVHLRATRTLVADPDAARSAVAAAFRDQGVVLSGERPVVGQRGSQMAAAINRKQLPLEVWADLVPTATGCEAHIQLQDRWWSPVGKAWGANRLYEHVFRELLAGVDRRLAQLDPTMATPSAEFVSAAADIALLERTNQALYRDHARAAVAAITRPPLRLNSPDGTTTVDATVLQSMLAVAHQVVEAPDTASGFEAVHLPALVERLDVAVARSAASCPVDASDGATIQLLYLQARIREAMPIKVEVTCADCKETQLTDPDFERLKKRNTVLRAVVDTAGTLAKTTVDPFAMLGLVTKYGKLDPDFVCGNCQGMESTSRVVALCPRCGQMCCDPLLVTCPKGHDLCAGAPALRCDARPPPPPPLSPPPPPPAV